MAVESIIIEKLHTDLSPVQLEVVNESHMHSVPANSETHFKVVIVSPLFEGKRSVARHQMIYACLSQELEGPVHALALHTYTQREWAERNEGAPDSPDCLGGSKQP
jgi:stress-induced morphogen